MRCPWWRKTHEPLFGVHDRRFVNEWVHEVCRRAGVREVPAHGMRGTHADLALEEGTSPEALARSMGHETFAVTAAHYLSDGAKASAGAKKVARGFGVLKGGKK